MTAALMKLVAAGMVCAALMTLCAGAQKELLRFGCACVMTVVLLSVVRQTPLPQLDTGVYRQQVQRQVETAQSQLRQAQLGQTEQDLAERLEEQADTWGLSCAVTVDCTADPNGAVTVRSVTVGYRSGPREKLESFRQSLCAQLALPMEQIVIQEECQP